MRNLVKTATAVAVAMAISTAANAVDSANSLDSLLSPEAKEMREQLNQNTSKLQEINSQISDLQKQQKDNQAEYDRAASDIKNNTNKQIQNKFDQQTQNRKLVDAQAAREELESQLEQMEPLEELTRGLNSAQKEEKIHSARITELEHTIDSNKQKVQELKEERTRLRHLIQEAKKKGEPSDENISKSRELGNQIKSLEGSYKSDNFELSEKRKNLNAINNTIQEYQQILNTRKDLETKVRRAQNNEDLVSEQIEKLQCEATDIEKKLTEAKTKKETANNQIQEIGKRLVDLNKQGEPLKGDIKNLTKNVTLVTHKELETRVTQAEGKAEEKIKNLNQEIDTNKKDVNEHLAKKADADKVKQDLAGKADKTTVEAVKKQLNEAKADKTTVEAVKTQLNEAKADKATVEAVKKQLNKAKADKTTVEAVKTQLNEAKADKATVEAVKKQLNEAKADKTTVEAVKTQLNEAKADKATVEAVKTQLNEAKADKAEVNANFDQVKKELTTKANQSAVDAVKGELITKVGDEATARQEADESINKLIVSNKAAQEDVNKQHELVLDDHDVKITENAQRIDIQGKKFDKELKDHDARITHNAIGVKDLQAAIFEGNDELTQAAHQVAAEKEKLEAMKAQAKEKGTKGATLAATKPGTNDIKAQQAKYDAAVAKMHELAPASRKEVKAHIMSLAVATQNANQALQANIDANKAAIAHNAQAIESNSRRIHNLDKREQRHMAQTAALAGLFQPYSIGRLNVTAAMGQYRSNTALAVGAGYRFDNNLAVKAGFSMNTKTMEDAAYNVGVNYEF